MNANIGLRHRVFKRTAAGVVSELGGGPFDDGVEFSTSATEMLSGGNVTDTSFAENDRILIRLYITNVGTMGGGFTGTLTFNAADAATGDSYAFLSETVTFKAEPTFAASQTAFRFYEDGTETGSTAIDAQDTDITRDVTSDSNLQLRVRLQETQGAAGASTDDYQLQYSKNGGSQTNITTSSSSVKGFNSGSLTDGNATTNRLGSGSGSFVAGEISEDGLVDDHTLTASNYTEHLYSLTAVAADLANNDTLDFRVLRNGAVLDDPALDSYSESNRSGTVNLATPTTGIVAQSFTPASSATLRSVKFYLKKALGSPTGDAVSRIYAHSGTYGTSSVPTGSALATSDGYDVSTIASADFELVTLTFSGPNQISVSGGTNYCVTIEYTNGDGSNLIQAGTDSSSPTHDGNESAYNGSTWAANVGVDLVFYVIPEVTPTITVTKTVAGLPPPIRLVSQAVKRAAEW
jgi:hypothetical protein